MNAKGTNPNNSRTVVMILTIAGTLGLAAATPAMGAPQIHVTWDDPQDGPFENVHYFIETNPPARVWTTQI